MERVLNCDLLILDDLGSEMTTSFVQSALYQIVNTRQMERRSTIISTNLTPGELARRYTPQIASRIEGDDDLDALVRIVPAWAKAVRERATKTVSKKAKQRFMGRLL